MEDIIATFIDNIHTRTSTICSRVIGTLIDTSTNLYGTVLPNNSGGWRKCVMTTQELIEPYMASFLALFNRSIPEWIRSPGARWSLGEHIPRNIPQRIETHKEEVFKIKQLRRYFGFHGKVLKENNVATILCRGLDNNYIQRRSPNPNSAVLPHERAKGA
ncbi:hypothetical protein HAX54_053363 [Datura stramonium]|uniref:Uncharacterized protein n=1 Tax=Datura stramonium TaxID=4076 RepID=A0ABS8WPF6_DATST|nr:hypothetical protein [Datura stramonium]